MRKFLIGTVAVIALLAAGIFIFRAPLQTAVMERLTADMFVAADTDAYDPGVTIGAQLPAIRAIARGAEVTDLTAFMGNRGVALFVNRSVDW